jgi:hypothetical protein
MIKKSACHGYQRVPVPVLMPFQKSYCGRKLQARGPFCHGFFPLFGKKVVCFQ